MTNEMSVSKLSRRDKEQLFLQLLDAVQGVSGDFPDALELFEAFRTVEPDGLADMSSFQVYGSVVWKLIFERCCGHDDVEVDCESCGGDVLAALCLIGYFAGRVGLCATGDEPELCPSTGLLNPPLAY